MDGSKWSDGGGPKDPEGGCRGEGQDEIPERGGHHGTVPPSKCGQAVWSGDSGEPSEWACVREGGKYVIMVTYPHHS